MKRSIIRRGRKIRGSKQIRAELGLESFEELENESELQKKEAENSRREDLMLKRDEIRRQQRQIRDSRPDFNLLVDVPPELEFNFPENFSKDSSSTGSKYSSSLREYSDVDGDSQTFSFLQGGGIQKTNKFELSKPVDNEVNNPMTSTPVSRCNVKPTNMALTNAEKKSSDVSAFRNTMVSAEAAESENSLFTIETPGVERRLMKKGCGCLNSSLLPFFINDSTLTSVLEYLDYEKPMHFVSCYKKGSTPEMVLAKRRIIHPEIPMKKLRRSQRNRVKPLRTWLGEQAVYRRDCEGNLELVDVTSVEIKDPLYCRYGRATLDSILEIQKRRRKMANAARQLKQIEKQN